jgi:hypothetical protein
MKELNKTMQDLKMEVKNNKEITKVENSGGRKPRKEIRSDGRENLRCKRFPRKHGHHNQRKLKMQKDSYSKDPGNPGHYEKTKPKENWYR